MALQLIDLTTPQPGGKFGDPTKTAWEKTNDNTLEIEGRLATAEAGGAAGEDALVQVNELADSTGASRVGYVARKVEDRLAETISILDSNPQPDTDGFVEIGELLRGAMVTLHAQGGGVVRLPGTRKYKVGASKTYTGYANVEIRNESEVNSGPNVDIRFVDCPNLVVGGRWTGTAPITATVSSSSVVDSATTLVTVSDASRLAVGDSIQTYQTTNTGVDVRSYQGTVYSKSNNALTLVNDTGLGGSPARIANGQKVKVVAADVYPTLDFLRCDRMVVHSGSQFELTTSLTNCSYAKIGNISNRNGNFSVFYCYGLESGDVNSVDGRFYGFGVFKSRACRFGKIFSDRAGVGGFVSKANADCTFEAITTRRSGVYGVQIRDDTGTPPQQVNVNLQETLSETSRTTFGSIKSVNDNRGLWLDNETVDVEINDYLAVGTIRESAFLCDGPRRCRINSINIRDYMTTDVIVDAQATAPVRFAGGTDLSVGQLRINNANHPTYTLSSSSPFTALRVGRLVVENSTGRIDLPSDTDVAEIQVLSSRAAPASGFGVLNLAGAVRDVIVRRYGYQAAEGFGAARAVNIVAAAGVSPSRIAIADVDVAGATFAAVYVDAAGDDLSIGPVRCTTAATHGASVRGSSTRLRVYGVYAPSATNEVHTTSLTSTDHLVESAVRVVRGTYSGTLAANATAVVSVSAPGVRLGSVVEVAAESATLNVSVTGTCQTTGTVLLRVLNQTAAELVVSNLKLVARCRVSL